MQNNNNGYDGYIDDPIDRNTGEVIQRNNQQLRNVDNDPLYLSPTITQKQLLKKVKEFAVLSNRPLKGNEEVTAYENCLEVCKQVGEKEGGFDKLNAKENQLVGQILAVSKLGLTLKKGEVWLDIRNNGKTPGRKDINIKYQYQGLEKIMLKFCSFNIDHFYKEVVCEDDEFELEVDVATGFEKLTKYVKAKGKPDNYRHTLKNITGAFEVAYIKNGNGGYDQFVSYIDKNRINRAYNAAKTKMIWNADTNKMVLKTAVHELFTKLAPYMLTTDEVIKDLETLEDEMDFGSKETKYSNSIEAETNVREEVATELVEDDL